MGNFSSSEQLSDIQQGDKRNLVDIYSLIHLTSCISTLRLLSTRPPPGYITILRTLYPGSDASRTKFERNREDLEYRFYTSDTDNGNGAD
jgi:hypothetical protein